MRDEKYGYWDRVFDRVFFMIAAFFGSLQLDAHDYGAAALLYFVAITLMVRESLR
jgi:hypothetical protein